MQTFADWYREPTPELEHELLARAHNQGYNACLVADPSKANPYGQDRLKQRLKWLEGYKQAWVEKTEEAA